MYCIIEFVVKKYFLAYLNQATQISSNHTKENYRSKVQDEEEMLQYELTHAPYLHLARSCCSLPVLQSSYRINSEHFRPPKNQVKILEFIQSSFPRHIIEVLAKELSKTERYFILDFSRPGKNHVICLRVSPTGTDQLDQLRRHHACQVSENLVT